MAAIALASFQAAAQINDGSTPVGARGATGLAESSDAALASATEAFSGDATWSIPIRVPPGTGGMTPSLSLSYSSGNLSDSWVGYGWSLGLGSIQRSTREGVPSYSDTADSFVFEGQELIPDGAVPGRYHTRRESFLRIERSADGSWEVRSPDGTVSRYGRSPDARVGRSSSEVFAWFLSERVNPHGNGLKVAYSTADPGNRYVSEIRYGLRLGSSGLESLNPADPNSIDRIVRFALEARPDKRLHYTGKFAQELNQRLREIEVIVGGQLLRRYRMNYGVPSSDSGRSLLRQVQEYGSDNGTVHGPRETSFSYSTNAVAERTGWADSDPDEPSILSSAFHLPAGFHFIRSDQQDGGTRLAELNGDGLVDVIREFKVSSATENDASSGAYLNSPSGFLPTPAPGYRLPFWNGGATRLWFANSPGTASVPAGLGDSLVDVDRDGRDDLLMLWLKIRANAPGWVDRTQELFQNSGSGWTSVLSHFRGDVIGNLHNNRAFEAFDARATDGSTQLAELDGDGRPDLITREFQAFTATHANFQPVALRGYSLSLKSAIGFSPTQSDRFNICTDNTDLCLMNSMTARREIYVSPPGPWFTNSVIRAGKRYIDVNGDGLDDHITSFVWPSSILPQEDFRNAYINNGTDFATDDRWIVPVTFDRESPSGPFSRDEGVRVADFNGDGIVDLVRAFDNAREAWFGTGNPDAPWVSAGAMSLWQIPDGLEFVDASGRDRGVRLADLNGDGLVDLIRAVEGVGQQVMFNRGVVPDRLTRATNQLGGQTNFEYRPSTSRHFGSATASGSPALSHVRQLVSAVEVFDGRTPAHSPSARTTFRYEGGLFDAADRELRGFSLVTATRPGAVSVTQFFQDDARAGLVEWTEQRNAAGVAWHRTENSYTFDETAPFVTLLERSTSLEYDGQGTPRRTRTDYQYDVFGNLLSTFAHGEVDAAGNSLPGTNDDRSFVTEYVAANQDLYLVNRPHWTKTLEGAPTSSSVVRETRFFYDGDASGGAMPLLGDLTARVEILAEVGTTDPKTTFTYDPFGNLKTVTDARENAGEIGAGAGTTTYTYDNTLHTFVTAVQNSKGHRTEYGYASSECSSPFASHPTGAGLVHVERGPNDPPTGTGWLRCYDAFGRLKLERAPDSLSESGWIYTDTPGQVSVTKSDLTETGARVARTDLDGLGRAIQTTSSGSLARDIVQTRTYDASGRLQSETAPRFEGDPPQATTFDYDPLGRIERTELPGARVRTIEYLRGVVTMTAVGDATHASRVSKRYLDPFGQITRVDEVNGAATYTTRYGYDAAGTLTSVVDHLGNASTIVPDRLGRSKTLSDPDVGSTSYTYDANGNLRTRTDALGTTTWTYDVLGRPETRTAPGAPAASWTYDTSINGKGLLQRRSDASGTYITVAYDGLGRVTEETVLADGKTFPFAQSFTKLGGPATRQYPTGRTLRWMYDSRGFLTELRDDGGSAYASNVEWDARARLVRWTASSGVRAETTYDSTTGRLQHSKVGSDLASPALQHLTYQPNVLDLIDGITDHLDQTRSQAFVYDGLSRLSRATGAYGTRHFAYDPIGNILCKDATEAFASNPSCPGGRRLVYPTPGPTSQRPHAPSSVDGSSVAYTATGNLEAISGRHYTYTPFGELATASQSGIPLVELRYDANGRRSRIVDRTQSPAIVRHLVTGDFEWNETRRLATINISLGGTLVATRTERFTAQAGTVLAAPIRFRGALRIALAPAVAASFLLGLHLVYLRKRGYTLARPAIGGSAAIVLYLGVVTPVLAQIPDGDMNVDDRLDAADALLMTRIIEGSLPETATSRARGDIAPLELAPETPSDLNAGDLALLLRAVSGEDVDGDGLSANDELNASSSPFREDSDRDGVADDVEIQQGSDPTQGDTDLDGFGDAADADPLNGVVFWYGDHLGSTTVRTRSDGLLLERIVYQPYGEAVQVAGGSASPPEFGYTGQRFEKSVGIYDYGARWYDPALGRFLQPDPVVPSPTNPQSLNRYAYVLNNPISRIDPTGNVSVSGIFGGVASAAGAVFSPFSNFAAGFGSSLAHSIANSPRSNSSNWAYNAGAAIGGGVGIVGGLALGALSTPFRGVGDVLGGLPFVGSDLAKHFNAAGSALYDAGWQMALRGDSYSRDNWTPLSPLTTDVGATGFGLLGNVAGITQAVGGTLDALLSPSWSEIKGVPGSWGVGITPRHGLRSGPGHPRDGMAAEGTFNSGPDINALPHDEAYRLKLPQGPADFRLYQSLDFRRTPVPGPVTFLYQTGMRSVFNLKYACGPSCDLSP